MVWVDAPPSDHLRDIVKNHSATARAYIVEKAWEANSIRDHVQVEFFNTGKIYEIEGIPLEYRPISDLFWVNDRYLAFNRWSQPHHGMHYVVDVIKKKLIVAIPFSEESYLKQQNSDQRNKAEQLYELHTKHTQKDV